MICEYCGKEQDGKYGSGRFCNSGCARAFSTATKRSDINAKVSQTLSGRQSWNGKAFQKGFDPRRQSFTQEQRLKAIETKRKISIDRLTLDNWNILSIDAKKKLVLIQQDNRCFNCGLSDWQGNPITLELDHIDGNRDNNTRENFRCLCPNCHSQTSTYRNKNADKRRLRVSDETLLQALNDSANIRQALIKVGLSVQHGNYERAKRLIATMPM